MSLPDAKSCVGCSACAASCGAEAIRLIPDAEGFLQPVVDEVKCVNCGCCERACPVLSVHPKPGVPLCFAARTNDSELLLDSTSGGIFSVLARKVLSRGGCVFGCVARPPDLIAHHEMTDAEDGLALMRGSKYVQSDVRNSFRACKEQLTGGRQVLFTGTPCQIDGLKRFLGKDYENLITMDFICHGVSSPGVLQKYLEEVSLRVGDSPVCVYYRNKRKSFSWNHSFLLAIDFNNKRNDIIEPLSTNPYYRIFMSGLAMRRGCARCPSFGGKSASDITVSDFWGIRFVPEVVPNDDKGMSAVFLHSGKSISLFEELRPQLTVYSLTFEQAKAGNPNYIKPSSAHKKRDYFMRRFRERQIAGLTMRCLNGPLLHRFVRQTLASVWHMLRGRK